jgi:hypothetical protein
MFKQASLSLQNRPQILEYTHNKHSLFIQHNGMKMMFTQAIGYHGNDDVEKLLQRNKNNIMEEGLKPMRETEDLSNRNATLEKENMLLNSLIRSLRDEENRQLKIHR